MLPFEVFDEVFKSSFQPVEAAPVHHHHLHIFVFIILSQVFYPLFVNHILLVCILFFVESG